MLLLKLDKPKSSLDGLGAVIVEQFLWYLVLGLGLPYFAIHILVAII